MEQPETIEVDGITVLVQRRKNMRNIRLRVDDAGCCIVSANSWVSLRQMRQLVERNLAWIRAQQAQRQSSPAYIAAHASKEEVEQWRALMTAVCPPLVAQWEEILGVQVKKLDYRNMKSKWGSCQPGTGRVCLNLRLALYPPECLEYVIVHELCHMLVPSHGPEFYELLGRLMPDYKQRRRKLQ